MVESSFILNETFTKFQKDYSLDYEAKQTESKTGLQKIKWYHINSRTSNDIVTRTTARGGEGKSRKSQDAARLENSNEQKGPANSQ